MRSLRAIHHAIRVAFVAAALLVGTSGTTSAASSSWWCSEGWVWIHNCEELECHDGYYSFICEYATWNCGCEDVFFYLKDQCHQNSGGTAWMHTFWCDGSPWYDDVNGEFGCSWTNEPSCY